MKAKAEKERHASLPRVKTTKTTVHLSVALSITQNPTVCPRSLCTTPARISGRRSDAESPTVVHALGHIWVFRSSH